MKPYLACLLVVILICVGSRSLREVPASVGAESLTEGMRELEKLLGQIPDEPRDGFRSKHEYEMYQRDVDRSLETLVDCDEAARVRGLLIECQSSGRLKDVVDRFGYAKLATIAEACYSCAVRAGDAGACSRVVAVLYDANGDVGYLSFYVLYQEHVHRASARTTMLMLKELSLHHKRAFQDIVCVLFGGHSSAEDSIRAYESGMGKLDELRVDVQLLDSIGSGNWDLLGTRELIRGW